MAPSQVGTINPSGRLPRWPTMLPRLAEMGWRAEAVEASEEAVSLYRELAAVDRAYLLELAASLGNHAILLREVGRRADAVTASEEAVSLDRELAAVDRDTHLPSLAASLANHAIWLTEVGRRADAVTASRRP